MGTLHKELTKEKWSSYTLCEKMANIGSEVIRAIHWRKKNNTQYTVQAFHRALELFDFTFDTTLSKPQLREIARLRSALVDDFAGKNDFKSTDKHWEQYFTAFTYLASKNRI